MYPARELKSLDHQKAVLLQAVKARRGQCVAAATCLAEPLGWIDLALLVWRQLAPLATNTGGSASLLLQRTTTPHLKFLRTFLRWWPFLAGIVRLGADLARPGPDGPAPASDDRPCGGQARRAGGVASVARHA